MADSRTKDKFLRSDQKNGKWGWFTLREREREREREGDPTGSHMTQARILTGSAVFGGCFDELVLSCILTDI